MIGEKIYINILLSLEAKSETKVNSEALLQGHLHCGKKKKTKQNKRNKKKKTKTLQEFHSIHLEPVWLFKNSSTTIGMTLKYLSF